MNRKRLDRPVGGVFAWCSDREVERVRRRGTEVTVGPGTAIRAEGDRSRWVFVVMSGSAVAWEADREWGLIAGDVFGACAVLVGGEEVGTLSSVTRSAVLALAAEDFAALLDECPGFAHGVVYQLAGACSALLLGTAVSTSVRRGSAVLPGRHYCSEPSRSVVRAVDLPSGARRSSSKLA